MASTTDRAFVLELGTAIRGRDGYFGRLTRLILDRETATVTLAVITPLDGHIPGHLVPIALVGGSPTDLQVNCTKDEIARFTEAEQLETHLTTGHEAGESVLGELGMSMARGPAPRPEPDYVTVELQNVPPGGVQLTTGQHVPGLDGDLGRLLGVEFDRETRGVHHLLVRTHHGLRHHVVRVPAAELSLEQGLQLRMTCHQIHALPDIHDHDGLIRVG